MGMNRGPASEIHPIQTYARLNRTPKIDLALPVYALSNTISDKRKSKDFVVLFKNKVSTELIQSTETSMKNYSDEIYTSYFSHSPTGQQFFLASLHKTVQGLSQNTSEVYKIRYISYTVKNQSIYYLHILSPFNIY